jgi:hypothetical protein
MSEQTGQLPEVVAVEDGWTATCQACGKWSITKDSELSAKRALAAHMGSCAGRASPSGPVESPGGTSGDAEEEESEYRDELKELGHILRDFGVGDKIIGHIKSRVLEDPAFLDSTSEFEELLRSEGVTNEHKVKVATKQIFKAIRPNVLRGFSEDNREERGRRPPCHDEGDREELKEKDREIKELTEKVHKMELQGIMVKMNGELALRDDRISRLEAAVSQPSGPTGKSLYDLLDKAIEKGDTRTSQVIDALKKPSGQFNPEVSRTAEQRREVAASIQEQLSQKEKVLEAENELLAAWYKGENPAVQPQKEKASP